jgi:hypothetical protein
VTRDSTGAHLNKKVSSEAMGHMAALNPTSAERCSPNLQLIWQNVDTRTALYLDLKFICKDTRMHAQLVCRGIGLPVSTVFLIRVMCSHMPFSFLCRRDLVFYRELMHTLICQYSVGAMVSCCCFYVYRYCSVAICSGTCTTSKRKAQSILPKTYRQSCN